MIMIIIRKNWTKENCANSKCDMGDSGPIYIRMILCWPEWPGWPFRKFWEKYFSRIFLKKFWVGNFVVKSFGENLWLAFFVRCFWGNYLSKTSYRRKGRRWQHRDNGDVKLERIKAKVETVCVSCYFMCPTSSLLAGNLLFAVYTQPIIISPNLR